jgi:hypothetical protein
MDPVIEFIVPQEGYLVIMPDTVDVQVEISDDRIITEVKVSIVNEDKIPVISTKYYYPGVSYFYLQTVFELVDESIKSGPYQILVYASDGVNTKNKYHDIQINEIPDLLENYIVITSDLDFKAIIGRLDASFETDTQFVFPRSFLISSVHSLWDKIFYVSGEPSDIYAMNPFTFETEWEIAANPPRAVVTSAISDEEFIFSTANGDVAITDINGDVKLRTEAYESKTITHLAADEDYIYVSHVSLSGKIHELTVFYRVTGEIKDQLILPGEIRGIVALDDIAVVLIPSGENITISGYDPDEMLLTHLNSLPFKDLTDAIGISETEIFLLTSDGVISYNIYYNTYTIFANQPYEKCRYEHINDDVFFIKDREISRFDRSSGNMTFQKSFPEKVLDFQILYNK